IKAGNILSAEARQKSLEKITRALFIETSPVPVKEALAQLHLMQPDVRLPLVRMQAENLRILLAAMQEKGLLEA
ncbi:MAG: dihydrodipicolinate synthase family protein, partial [Clostridia bacterium]|nr:dihydrodipicolinate synthase family protein [Clostridia bacterium]